MTRETPASVPAEADLVVEGWENERDTERAKINIRGMAILLLLCAALWIRAQSPIVHLSNAALTGIVGASVLMTVVEAVYLWSPGRVRIPRGFKYVTVFGDMAFISLLIYDTGGAQSPFFYVYFVFLISNCLRYGLLMSLFIALTVNVLYVIVLGLGGSEARTASVLGGEGLKILAFWVTAFYGGGVSSRLRRQATQLRVYEETILELRAQQKSMTGFHPTPAPSAPADSSAVPIPSSSSTSSGSSSSSSSLEKPVEKPV